MIDGTSQRSFLMTQFANHLANEKSPYLIQHINNPVDWYPWSDEAFEKARREDKPIFLSIGYATCHWCHVMAHESFEDEEVAKLLNEAFVCIKVDREERPDIDGIYMTAVQMLTGRGGWPLTVILTHDKKPFFAGTYFPKERRYGQVGMLDLIPRINEIWKTQRPKIHESAESLSEGIKRASHFAAGEDLNETIVKNTYQDLLERYDEEFGGFGERPKFPTPHNFLFLLRYWQAYKEPKALEMVSKTLHEMVNGGIWDHVGFGFHRYSTDRHWLLPHFEKMLYDQALMAIACIESYQATADETFKETTTKILEYVSRDMTTKDGAFCSAEDADSEGEEGKFYVWSQAEMFKILSPEEAELLCRTYNVQREGNFHDEISGENTGKNILHLSKDALREDKNKLEAILQKLYQERKKRIHPLKDDKILTDWNAMMIVAFARASQVFGKEKYYKSACAAADYLLNNMRDASTGRLFHSYREGQFNEQAYLDDYAFLVWALIELYETNFDIKYLKTALELSEILLLKYWDQENGAFYSTASDGEVLITRQKEIYDGAIPAGNSVAFMNLQKLALLTGKTELEEKARALAGCFAHTVQRSRSAHTMFLSAFTFALADSPQILIVSPSPSEPTAQLAIELIQQKYLPNKVVLLKTPSNESSIAEIANWTADKQIIDNKTTFYVCFKGSCQKPVHEVEELKTILNLH